MKRRRRIQDRSEDSIEVLSSMDLPGAADERTAGRHRQSYLFVDLGAAL